MLIYIKSRLPFPLVIVVLQWQTLKYKSKLHPFAIAPSGTFKLTPVSADSKMPPFESNIPFAEAIIEQLLFESNCNFLYMPLSL
jgi:hypothetical protein